MINGQPHFTITDRMNDYVNNIISLINEVDSLQNINAWKVANLCLPANEQNKLKDQPSNNNQQDFNYLNIDDLPKLHKLYTKNVIETAGMYRKWKEEIYLDDKVHYVAPHSDTIPQLLKTLYEWINNSKLNFLITSCVFHYELLWIHPFTDGNGRTSRGMHQLMLMSYHPIFSLVMIPLLITDNKKEHVEFWRQHPDNGDATFFVEHLLELIHRRLVVVRDMIKEAIENGKKAKEKKI